MWVRGIGLMDVFHASKLSVWFGVIDVPFEHKCLRETSNEIKSSEQLPGCWKLAAGPSSLAKQQQRVVSKLRKSSQAAYFWYGSQTYCQGCSTIDLSSIKLCWSYCLADRLSSYRGSLSQGALTFPWLATDLRPKSSWWSCYWKEDESVGTAGRAFGTVC